MPRPKKLPSGIAIISVYVEPELKQRLEYAAALRGISVSELLRQLAGEWVERELQLQQQRQQQSELDRKIEEELRKAEEAEALQRLQDDLKLLQGQLEQLEQRARVLLQYVDREEVSVILGGKVEKLNVKAQLQLSLENANRLFTKAKRVLEDAKKVSDAELKRAALEVYMRTQELFSQLAAAKRGR